jgi:beta-lactamase class A
VNKIEEILQDFCGADAGRSASFHHAELGLRHVRGGILRPIASIAKLPLAMGLYDMAAAGEVDLSAKTPVSGFSATRYVSILAGFEPDTGLTLQEIAALSLITSDNPLAVYITGVTGFERANALLKRLHCNAGATVAAGFTEDELGPKNRANLASANDLILVLIEVAKNPRYRHLYKALENNLRNNRIPALLPDSALIAHKTGSLNGVVNDAGVIRDEGVEFTLAFLTDDQPDPTKTSADIAECAKRIYDLMVAHRG